MARLPHHGFLLPPRLPTAPFILPRTSPCHARWCVREHSRSFAPRHFLLTPYAPPPARGTATCTHLRGVTAWADDTGRPCPTPCVVALPAFPCTRTPTPFSHDTYPHLPPPPHATHHTLHLSHHAPPCPRPTTTGPPPSHTDPIQCPLPSRPMGHPTHCLHFAACLLPGYMVAGTSAFGLLVGTAPSLHACRLPWQAPVPGGIPALPWALALFCSSTAYRLTGHHCAGAHAPNGKTGSWQSTRWLRGLAAPPRPCRAAPRQYSGLLPGEAFTTPQRPRWRFGKRSVCTRSADIWPRHTLRGWAKCL